MDMAVTPDEGDDHEGHELLSLDAVPVMHLLWKPRPEIRSRLLKELAQVHPEKLKSSYDVKDPMSRPVQSQPVDFWVVVHEFELSVLAGHLKEEAPDQP